VNRFARTTVARTLAAAVVLTLPRGVFACAACYGQSDSPLAVGMNWGIMALLGVILSVLSGIVVFFVHVGRRSAAQHEEPQPESKTGNN
jgi:hypothetical protein